MSTTASFDITSPAFKHAPFEILADLRKDSPIAKIALPGGESGWLVTRYDDVEAFFRDSRLTNNPADVYPPEVLAMVFPHGEFSDALLHSVIFQSDPVHHARLRRLVSASFTPRFIETWQPRIQQITEALIDRLPGHGEIDFVQEIAFPLPMQVISEILGVPTADQEKFRIWSNLYVDAMGNPAAAMQIKDEMQEFLHYLHALLEAKQQQPAPDLLSRLLQVELEGDRLSRKEIIGMAQLLILAGNETTTALLSSAMLTFFQHPEQAEAVKSDPALLKQAIEEVIRYRGPLMNANDRWVAEDFEHQGQQLKKGDHIYLCVTSANRDESRFPDAATFDIRREDSQRHLGFGKGMHFCLGAPLARLEASVGLSTVLRRMPDIALAVGMDEITWRPGITSSTLEKLPVRF
ncbi:Cytochrome P450 107B1 [Nocardia cerradoensis]|uniref:Cytochrome P450 107B1 n=1 Tax=Nocardia cerradoensis TaxID=85688 RepID=A0A231GW52_9NOCA|nr:cytochrome P450 [Nocardia cerradoensis]OXR40863.1 Cytochrome P450 107B1 [Nocardia cerradoensis]